MKNIIKSIMLALLVLTFSTAVNAQPGLDDDAVDDAPIDGGITLLAGAGLALGIKKLYEHKTGKPENNPE